MRKRTVLLTAAAALAAGLTATPAAFAQYKTYPGYYNRTPSPSYYQLPNEYDRDTYMNPNPFPAYRSRTYEERYRAAYPPSTYVPTPPPPMAYRYNAAVPTPGYYYGPGPYVNSHYGRSGRMTFRYGWW